MSVPTIFDSPEGPGPLGSTGSLHIEKEATQHGIIKSHERAQHQGTGFGTTGGIHVEKEKTQHGIVRSEEKAQHQGSGFGTTGGIFVEKEKTQHGIVRSEERAQHGGTGFGTTGGVFVEKEKTQHGIVRSEERAQHQGSGFATMGSLETEKQLVTHGIIAPGTKIKDGPIDHSADEIKESVQKRLEQKADKGREQKVREWLERTVGQTFSEESLQEALKNGVRICTALNHVFPGSITKINKAGITFSERENVGNYVEACKKLGFNKSNLFETADLYDGANMPKVVENLHELAFAPPPAK
jgi:hypothetical protein